MECDHISGLFISDDAQDFLTSSGRTIPADKLSAIFSLELLQLVGRISMKIKALALSAREIALLQALAIFSPGKTIPLQTS